MKVVVPFKKAFDKDEATFQTDTPMGEVLLEVNSSEVEDRTFGLSVARLDIKNQDGSKARFFVTARLTAKGRPVLVVTAKGRDGKETIKEVTGAFNPATFFKS